MLAAAEDPEVSQYLGDSCPEVLTALQEALGPEWKPALQKHLQEATPQQWLAYAIKIKARRGAKGRIDADRLALLDKSPNDLTQAEISEFFRTYYQVLIINHVYCFLNADSSLCGHPMKCLLSDVPCPSHITFTSAKGGQ